MATQDQQIYIFMNNNIVSIVLCVWWWSMHLNILCRLFNAKKEIFSVVQSDRGQAAAED